MPAATTKSRFWTIAGGPAVNVVLCLLTLPQIVQSGQLADCLNPFVFPAVTSANGSLTAASIVIMLFATNWLLLLINLLPVYPLDGGRMLYTLMSARLE